MRRLAFRIVNVFTVDGARLSGNPLCVFENAEGLSSDEMQALARQTNLSETTFILPSTSADAEVRIFTPSYEMPFAGHPTLGTASVVAAGRESVVLSMKAGLVPVKRQRSSYTLRTAQAPQTRPVLASREELAQMLGLPADAVSAEPLWVSTGVEQLVIPIRSVELVRAAQPDAALLRRYAYSETRKASMAYLVSEARPHWTVRFFFTVNGAVLEDPSTGSACANLGGWLHRSNRTPIEVSLRQGEAVGRPSRLDLRVDGEGAIFVSGEVIELGRGEISL